MARKLRIAASVFFGTLTVALCLLWVRSFWRIDSASFGWNHWTHSVQSLAGRIEVESWYWKLPMPSDLEFGSIPLRQDYYRFRHSTGARLGFLFAVTNEIILVSVPYWALVLVCVATVSLPWIAHRFSLRTLLIATTLVAVALGLGVRLTS